MDGHTYAPASGGGDVPPPQMGTKKRKNKEKLFFVDVFAGCGGISLGLISSGWTGCFAIEKSSDAFGTLKQNLASGSKNKFDWPQWLPKSAISTTSFLQEYSHYLPGLKGKVTLLAGGPPCQGFSLAGRRAHSDPRNLLTEDYIRVVKELEPRFLLIENVRGFTLPFKKHGDEKSKSTPYSSRVIDRLENLGYCVFSKLVDLSNYGVPQFRKRFIIIAIRNGDPALEKLGRKTPFDLLEKGRRRFLASKGLPHDRPVNVSEAIGDLAIQGNKLVDCDDTNLKGYKQVEYSSPASLSGYTKLMRKGTTLSPGSLRLPKHAPQTIALFQRITELCPRGKTIGEDARRSLGIKKHAITPLDANQPSATITTLPDDIIHYSEPRILTVRENARIQTFPDWFKFTGKYTTGGKNRKNECPRYTQVGNAVPPLFSEAIGQVLKYLAS